MILGIVLNKVLEATEQYLSSYENVGFYKEQLEMLDKDDPETRDEYIGLSSYIEVAELMQKYDKDSWQTYIIESRAEEIIKNKKNNEGTDFYEQYKEEYDIFIKRLETDDWRAFVKDELNLVNENIKEYKKMGQEGEETVYLENEKQILEWRLEQDISYGNDNLNQCLEQWKMAKDQIYSFEQKQKNGRTSDI